VNFGELLGNVLKNTRATAGIGAVICTLIAVGVYTPSASVESALTAFVGAGAGAAAGALVALVVSKIKGAGPTDEAAK
jgi:hypothetical protein